MVTQQDKVSL